ncbi:MAG: sigma-70 family RNA polymerase sigma factor [Polyangiaceae bacterium]|nr:sigma-70 family RNA polymerase sigma factor [Polyangiaceae bacterium]
MTPPPADTLAQAAARAHEQWAARGVRGELAAFLRYVEARAAEVAEPQRGHLHVDDLYLAFACGRGDRAALAAFEAALLPVARQTFARLNVPAEVGDDVLGALRERLFVASGGVAPLVEGYSGRGRLVSWLRSMVANAALKALRDRRRFVDVERAEELPMADAELVQLRGADAALFRDAFDQAFAGLTREQRNLLRQHFLDGLTFEALGRLHGVNVSTAWRRVEAARSALVAAVRARLNTALGLSESAANSVVRSAYVEASIASLLRGTPARAASGT